jgi:Holliday junction resolvase RusA-like endonuclease
MIPMGIFESWFIPGNTPSSKNSRQWTGKYFITSKSVTKYRQDTNAIYMKLKDSFVQSFNQFELPVYITFTFTRNSKRKFDYANPLQTVQDDMTKHGWIPDDNCDIMIPVFEKYKYNKNNSGVLITLTDKRNKKIKIK